MRESAALYIMKRRLPTNAAAMVTITGDCTAMSWLTTSCAMPETRHRDAMPSRASCPPRRGDAATKPKGRPRAPGDVARAGEELVSGEAVARQRAKADSTLLNSLHEKIVLLRHGESVWNKENRFTGWKDVDLTPKGVEEARDAGRLLAAEGYDFDFTFTSVLKRAIRTLNLALEEMDRLWLPVEKDWRLNERHYGALQGLNKAETAAKFGEEQVLIWRRSYDIPPPPLEPGDERDAARDRRYASLKPGQIPRCECLKDTVRALSRSGRRHRPRVAAGERGWTATAAHRALCKYSTP